MEQSEQQELVVKYQQEFEEYKKTLTWQRNILDKIGAEIQPKADSNASSPKKKKNAEENPVKVQLLDGLVNTGNITDNRVYDVMIKVDRINFVPNEIKSKAYEQTAQGIGFNRSISSPQMHALSLENCIHLLKVGGKLLDIGSGSGYLGTCFAELMGSGSKIIMLDTSEDLIQLAMNNAKKCNPNLITEQRMIGFTGSDLKRVHSSGPYDFIYIEAAIEYVPQKLLNLVLPGGRIWVPIGPENGSQQIYIFDKDKEGSVTKREILAVRYRSLNAFVKELFD